MQSIKSQNKFAEYLSSQLMCKTCNSNLDYPVLTLSSLQMEGSDRSNQTLLKSHICYMKTSPHQSCYFSFSSDATLVTDNCTCQITTKHHKSVAHWYTVHTELPTGR